MLYVGRKRTVKPPRLFVTFQYRGYEYLTRHFTLVLQVYKRLNHLNITISYNVILRVVEEISKHHLLPLTKWLSEGAFVKFDSDN